MPDPNDFIVIDEEPEEPIEDMLKRVSLEEQEKEELRRKGPCWLQDPPICPV